MKPLKRLLILCVVLVPLSSWAEDAEVEGRWLSGSGEGWIEIRRLGDSLIGTAAGSTIAREGDPPRLDDKNPDPALRNRPLFGITIMQGFVYDGDGHWSGGTIYDPNSGRTYRATLRLIDRDTLKLRGYIGLSLFGRTDTWTRDDL